MKKVEEEPIFVGVKNPADIRRNLLEASRGVVESLQRYERFKSTRGHKLELVHKLKGDIKEISKLIYQLRASLPIVKLKPEPKPKIVKPKAVKPKAVNVFKVKKKIELPNRHRTELDKLEAELGDIERKLSGIS